MIRFQRESLFDIADEIGALWLRHYDEMAEDREIAPFAPDWERYALLEEAGKLVILTARTEAGTMVGYLMAILDRHLHFAETLFAGVDLYWLAPEYRGGRTALRMLKRAEDEFREAGAQMVMNHAWHRGSQSKLLSHLGYRPVEVQMLKVL